MRFRVCALVVTLAALTACGGGDDGGDITNPPGGGGNSTTSSISVKDNVFDPVSTTVPVGTTVTWTWAGRDDHNVVFPTGPSSATQRAGTFQRTFSAAGTFDYTCTLHAGMNGKVIVR